MFVFLWALEKISEMFGLLCSLVISILSGALVSLHCFSVSICVLKFSLLVHVHLSFSLLVHVYLSLHLLLNFVC